MRAFAPQVMRAFARRWHPILLTVAVACSASKPQPAGGECLIVTDCQNGLVCVRQRCSSDLSGIVNIEDAAPQVPRANAAGDAGDDADAEGAVDSAPTGDDAGNAAADDATQDVAALE